MKRSALGALIIVVATAGAVVAVVLLNPGGHFRPTPCGDCDPAPAGKPQTLLLLGSDRRIVDTHAGRSDTMMLVRLDPRSGATSVLSLPRDLRVRIPGHGVAKLNAAYAIGGASLTVKTIRRLLQVPINHVVDVRFSGFQRAVDILGCIYVDVDHRYFHSNAGLAPALQYSEIDLQPGYQRQCGADALSYVRFRHADSDLVRAARQQAFLRATKEEAGSGAGLGELERLAGVVARDTEVDHALNTPAGLLRTLKLVVAGRRDPIVQVRFPARDATDGTSDLLAPRMALRSAVRSFLHPRVHRAAGRAGTGATRVAAPLVAAPAPPAMAASSRLPVLAPAMLTPLGRFTDARAYVLHDRDGHPHAAYRMVVAEAPALGRSYGVEGTTWADPPLLAHPTRTLRSGRRSLELFADAGRLRLVALRTRSGVYWLSNTLDLALSNAQMLRIARSLHPTASP